MGCSASKQAAGIKEEKENKDAPGENKQGSKNGLKHPPVDSGKVEQNDEKTNKSQGTPGKHKPKTSKVPAHPEVSLADIMRGKVDIHCPVDAKVVRIFTSSTFTDTFHERNALMERVYPRLRGYCQQQGLSFQVVDMRWGIRDEATNDHMTTELCLRELNECQRLSTGPNFVTFLSHKYGYRPLVRVIEAAEFDKLMSAVNTEEAKSLVKKWYRKDENTLPVSYVLQSVSSHLPSSLDKNDKDAYKAAWKQWGEESTAVYKALCTAALTKLTNPDTQDKYTTSVTETEIRYGILEVENVNSSCLWFKRDIKNIEEQDTTKTLSRYLDCTGDDSTTAESRKMLKTLKQEKITSTLPSDKILTYDVEWTEKGIDPEMENHKDYIDKLCRDFEVHTKKLIDQGIEERPYSAILNDSMSGELLQHVSFCQDKCRTFYGREDILLEIKKYLNSGCFQPCVVHGISGSGKTSVLAMAAKMTRTWLSDDCVVILRFLGITPSSSLIRSTLVSVIEQINTAYEKKRTDTATDIKSLTRELSIVLRLASASRPLVILLDSLDQLDSDSGAKQLAWLPQALPTHVKLIVSTLPDDTYECFPRLKVFFRNKTNFVEVPNVNKDDANGMLKQLLKAEGRNITKEQTCVLTEAFQQCPLPLYLQLCVNEASRWSSFWTAEQTVLESSVRQMIDSLFTRVETNHGKLLTQRIMAYITLSRNGLTETELEDILSCDEEVLNDVYQYWTPPVRRLPPLLLVRVKAELNKYLVERGADGSKVTYWYHRQFLEAARERYCSDDITTQKMHTHVAEYFLGKWSNGAKKPYTDNKGKSDLSDRLVAVQPLMFDKMYNLRKMMELPHHLVAADMLTELKEHVLCNIDWLLAKLKATSYRDVLDDFVLARGRFPEDEDIKILMETIQLSHLHLEADPNQLPGEILGRVSKGIDSLRSACRNVSVPCLVLDKPRLTSPGGKLLYIINAHSEEIVGLKLMRTRPYAVTCSKDKSMKLWNLVDGRMVRAVNQIGDNPCGLELCCDETYAVTNTKEHLAVIRLEAGKICHKIKLGYSRQYTEDEPTSLEFTSCAEKSSQVAALVNDSVVIYDVETAEKTAKVKDPYLEKGDTYENSGNIVGSKIHLAVGKGRHARIFSLKKSSFLHNIEVYEIADAKQRQREVQTMTFTLGSKKIIISNILKNDLEIYNVNTAKLVSHIKGVEKDYSGDFHMGPDNKQMYFSNIDNVGIWDLENETKKNVLQHPHSTCQAASIDMQIFVTTSIDNILRVWKEGESVITEDSWNASVAKVIAAERRAIKEEDEDNEVSDDCVKDDVEEQSEGETECEETEEEEEEEEDYHLEIETKVNPWCPRYMAYYWKEKWEHDQCDLLGIYDVVLKDTVRSGKVDTLADYVDGEHRIYLEDAVFLDETRLLVPKEATLAVLNMDTMKYSQVMQGVHPGCNAAIQVSKKGKEIVVLKKGSKKMKIWDTDSGKIKGVLKSVKNGYLEDMRVSHNGATVIAINDEENILVFDMAKKMMTHLLKYTPLEGVNGFSLEDSFLTSDGARFVTQISQVFPEKADDFVSVSSVWNLETGKLECTCVDKEAVDKHFKTDGESPDVKIARLFNDSTILSTAHDNIIRKFNSSTGEMIANTSLLQTADELSVDQIVVPYHDLKSSKFVTMASNISSQSSFMIVLDVEAEWTPVACLHLDFEWRNLVSVCNGRRLVMWNPALKEFVTLDLHVPGVPDVDEDQNTDPIFKDKKLDIKVAFMKKVKADANPDFLETETESEGSENESENDVESEKSDVESDKESNKLKPNYNKSPPQRRRR